MGTHTACIGIELFEAGIEVEGGHVVLHEIGMQISELLLVELPTFISIKVPGTSNHHSVCEHLLTSAAVATRPAGVLEVGNCGLKPLELSLGKVQLLEPLVLPPELRVTSMAVIITTWKARREGDLLLGTW